MTIVKSYAFRIGNRVYFGELRFTISMGFAELRAVTNINPKAYGGSRTRSWRFA